MKILFLTEKKYKDLIPTENYESAINIFILEIEKVKEKNVKSTNLIILLTTKIFDRKDKNYLRLLNLINNKKVKLIEISFEKSQIANNRAFSKAIIHGFGRMTYDIIEKIIKKSNLNYL